MDERLRDERTTSLLAWGEDQRRDLPWRHTRDPWSVLVSEVMLQQTQVGRVVEKYETFTTRWPTAAHLAAADLDEVLRVWSGLGYPRRARNLHRCSGAIVERHEGEVPVELDELMALPGVGPYTARAVLAFAHERDVGVLDTNVGRILARWVGRPLLPREAQVLADALVPKGRSWAWNQALFDLGAELCTKRSADCERCPVKAGCAWRGLGPDPSEGSAAVSRRQAPFSGSDRQARGRLLRALEMAPLLRASAGDAMELDDPARTERIVASLVGDGLITECDELLMLGSQ